MHTHNLETKIDDSRNELDVLRQRVTACKEKCRAAVFELVGHLAYVDPNSDDMGSIFQSIDNIAWDDECAIQRALGRAEEALGDLEEADMRRSSPICI